MHSRLIYIGGGSGYTIIKMNVVPHGISITSPGNHSSFSDSDNLKCELAGQQQATDMLTAPQPFGVCVPDSTYTPGPATNLPVDMIPFLTNETEKFATLQEFVSS